MKPAATHCVMIGDQPFPYTLLRHPLRKRLTLRVTASGEIEARAPWRAGVAQVERFIREQSEWLTTTRQQMLSCQTPPTGDGSRLPLLDEWLTLRILPEGVFRIRRVDQELHLPAPLTPTDLENTLERWYRQQARLHLPARLRHWAERMNTPVRAITIRGQSSRWGSCSAKGNISLNWHLMRLPACLVDYVLVHELCHRHEMNHSPAFWARVAAVLPDYEQSIRKLKTCRID